MKHEGREDVQRNEGIYIFRILHILHVFVFKMLFLNMHRRVNVFLIGENVFWRDLYETNCSS
jgi:hypothetical protein